VLPGSNTLLKVTVTPGTDPPSTSLVVTGNLAAIGGSETQAFAQSGSNLFTFLATVGPETSPGLKSLPIRIADGQGRHSHAAIALNVGLVTNIAYLRSRLDLSTGMPTDTTLSSSSEGRHHSHQPDYDQQRGVLHPGCHRRHRRLCRRW